MKFKPLCLAMVTAGIMAIASSAHASPIMSVTISDEDGTNSSSHTINPTWNTSTSNVHTTTGSNSWGGLTINSASFDPDPVVTFDFTTVNTSSKNKTYTFSFNEDLIPSLTGLIDSHAELTGVLTDTNGDAGAFVNTVASRKLLESFDVDVNGTQVPKNVDIGTSITTVGTQFFSQSGTLNCVANCETMSAVVSFVLSKGDTVHFTGMVSQFSAETISPVPAPGAAWLFGSALAGLISFRRRQQNV